MQQLKQQGATAENSAEYLKLTRFLQQFFVFSFIISVNMLVFPRSSSFLRYFFHAECFLGFFEGFPSAFEGSAWGIEVFGEFGVWGRDGGDC